MKYSTESMKKISTQYAEMGKACGGPQRLDTKTGVKRGKPPRRPETRTARRLLRTRPGSGNLNAWLQNFRRIIIRYERKAENFLGLVQLACILILLKVFLR